MISTFLNYCVYELCIRILLDIVISNFNRYEHKYKLIDYVLALSKEIKDTLVIQDEISSYMGYDVRREIVNAIEEEIIQEINEYNR